MTPIAQTTRGMQVVLRVLAALAFLAAPGMARAGQDCGERPAPTPLALQAGTALGERVTQHLESTGAALALVGRIGINLGEFGQRYSHVGVAMRDHASGRWEVVHLFNPCGKSESELQTQPLVSFYAVELFDAEALVVVPSYTVQNRLRGVFMHPGRFRQLHHKAYNLISHPFNTLYQNSNQWVLETIAMALDESGATLSRQAAQRWLQAQGFEPAGIRIPPLRRTGARLFSPHVHFSDHTQEEFEKSTYLVVTVDSIVRFLGQRDAGMRQQALR